MLNQDYEEILSLLKDFLLVGAYAMAVHGYPRATADIDIFLKPEKDNASRAFKALKEYGAPLFELTPKDLETPGTVFQIGIKPRRIDFITEIDGLTFDKANKNKKIISLQGLSIPVISKDDLIKNKLSTGREKDRLDAENLKNKI